MYTVSRSPASRLYLDALPKALANGYAPLPLLPAKRTPLQKGWADFYCEGDLPSAEAILAFCDVTSLPYSREERHYAAVVVWGSIGPTLRWSGIRSPPTHSDCRGRRHGGSLL
jgi:hypothetical protein